MLSKVKDEMFWTFLSNTFYGIMLIVLVLKMKERETQNVQTIQRELKIMPALLS